MNIWDKTKPLPSEYLNTFYDYLRNLKELFLDRFGLDHNMDGVLDTTLATADGYHEKITMPDFNYDDGYGNQITEPVHIDDSYEMFVKKIDGLEELFIQGNNTIYQMTQKGKNKIVYSETALSYYSQKYYLNGIYFDIRQDVSSYNNEIYTSTDGVNYSLITSNFPQGTFQQLIYLNGYYLVRTNVNTVYYSSNLSTWTKFSPSNNVYNIGTAGSNLLIFGYISTTQYVWTSPDGTTWTQRNSPGTLTRFVQAGNYHIATGAGTIYRTVDGISWASNSYSYDVNSALYYFNNKLITIYNSSFAYSSDYGVSWTSLTYPSIGKIEIIGYANGSYIALKYTATKKIYESEDLLTWVENQTIFSLFIYDISYSKFVIINNFIHICANSPGSNTTELVSKNIIG